VDQTVLLKSNQLWGPEAQVHHWNYPRRSLLSLSVCLQIDFACALSIVRLSMGWQPFVGSLDSQVSFEKEPYIDWGSFAKETYV